MRSILLVILRLFNYTCPPPVEMRKTIKTTNTLFLKELQVHLLQHHHHHHLEHGGKSWWCCPIQRRMINGIFERAQRLGPVIEWRRGVSSDPAALHPRFQTSPSLSIFRTVPMKGEKKNRELITKKLKKKKRRYGTLRCDIPPAVLPPIRTLRGLAHTYTPGGNKE